MRESYEVQQELSVQAENNGDALTDKNTEFYNIDWQR